MNRLEWSDRASYDIERIADGYAEIDADLPEEIIRRIDVAALPLIENPRLGRAIGRHGLRKWSARRTPFMLLYVVRGATITVVRVVHSASNWVSLV